jgi:ubiquitin C-terminal hydrolase
MSLWRLPPVVIIQLKRFQFTQHTRRKLRELVIFPIEGLDLSRIMADSKNGGKLSNGNPPKSTVDTQDNGNDDALLYDLYGVVHHQGALSGGHYVASLKSELDGQWRLFNDAQIYEIHSRDVVDTSAYILFYIRRDAKEAKLGDFWKAREGHQGLTEEEMNKLIKGRSERCVIS